MAVGREPATGPPPPPSAVLLPRFAGEELALSQKLVSTRLHAGLTAIAWVQPAMLERPRHFRTIFLSDVHLGTKSCQADLLLDFLRLHDAEAYYLVGDIVDGWQLKRNWYWPQEHNDVVQKLLRKARKGSRIVYIAGNHDEFLRDFTGTHFGGVEVVERAMH